MFQDINTGLLAIIVSFFTLLISVVYGWRGKELRESKQKNHRYQKKLLKAFISIQAYQREEEKIAEKENMNVQIYRKGVRAKSSLFQSVDSNFLSPKNIEREIEKLKNK